MPDRPAQTNARRILTPLGVTFVCAALVCGASVGLRIGSGWRSADMITAEPRATQAATAPAPVSIFSSPTPLAELPLTEPPLAHDIAPESATPGPTALPQVNMGILVIESFEARVPSLQAVWIAALHPETKSAVLLGLSPYAWVKLSEGSEVRLLDTYIYDPATGSGGTGFDTALAAVAYTPLAGTITIDGAVLAEIVNRLGGVDLAGTRMDGAGSAAYALTSAPGDPFTQSQHQVDFANSLRDSAVISMFDLAPYLDLVIERGHSTLPADMLYALASTFQGYNPAKLAIAPPVPDPQLVITAPDGQPAVMMPPETAASAIP